MGAVVYKSRFEHSAFVWDSDFDDRRVRFYSLDDKIAVEEEIFDPSQPLTRQIIVERFLIYRCKGDRERYLYRDLQIKTFLEGLNLDHLRRGSHSQVNTPVVLVDDRRNLDSLSMTESGNNGSFRQALSAHNLYHFLRKSVCLGIPQQYEANQGA
jgi:hypothetical protein